MADPNNIALHDQRVVFIQPPKTGNLSQKRAVARALGWRNLAAISHPDKGWHYVSGNEAAELQREAGYLVIATVRNPWDRCVSMYLDRVRRHFEFDRLRDSGLMPDFSFAQFVHAIAERSDAQVNEHFRPCTYSIGAARVDVLVRFETMTSDWDTVTKRVRAHCGLDLPALEIWNSTHRREHYSAWYDWDSVSRVARRYEADTRLAGGYVFEGPQCAS